MSLGFNSKHMTCANRSITLGSMLVSGHGAGSSKRMYHWHTKHAQGKEFENIFGITRGQWGPPTYPKSFYHPYYSSQMYVYPRCLQVGCGGAQAEPEFY